MEEEKPRQSLLNLAGQKETNEKGRLTRALAITAFFAALGNSFTHGYNTGVLNSPSELIKGFLNSSTWDHYNVQLSDKSLELLWSLSVSIYLIGGCAGAFSAGFLADRFGRKKAVMLMVIPGLIGDLLFGFCKMANSMEMLIVGRLIIGFSCGAGSGLVPMYLTEISPVNIRGAMGVLHQLALTIGILISQLMGLRQLLGNEKWWPLLLALSCVPFALCCAVLPWFPDSPRWLLVKKGNEEEAVKALQRFRGKQDVDSDIQEMQKEIREQAKEPAWSLAELFNSKYHRIPLMLVSVLAVVQQLSGINMVFYYSNGVFLSAEIKPDHIQYATLGIGAVNVLMTILSVVLVEKAGRRPLLLGGMVAMVVALVVMTIALVLQDLPLEVIENSIFLQKLSLALPYVSIVTMVAFVIGFAIGLGSIPQFIGAELFKQGPRPAAMSFAGLMNWLANFIVGISFPFIQIGVKQYCMLFFIVFLVGFGIVIWKFLPETKNKSFAEIARELNIPQSDENDNVVEVPLSNVSKGQHTNTAEPESVTPLLQ